MLGVGAATVLCGRMDSILCNFKVSSFVSDVLDLQHSGSDFDLGRGPSPSSQVEILFPQHHPRTPLDRSCWLYLYLYHPPSRKYTVCCLRDSGDKVHAALMDHLHICSSLFDLEVSRAVL